MPKKKVKIILAVLGTMIVLSLALVFIVSAWAYFRDKTNGELVSSGLTRRYLLYVPGSYDRSKSTPLVISIHPAGTWPAFQQSISRWNEVADNHGFIVVYPAGTGLFFSGPGAQVWPGGRALGRDVKFITELIDTLQTQYNIDPERIYINGMSNGGTMALELGCVMSDRIAAVGAVAPAQPRPPGQDECAHSNPLPTVIFHGTADRIAPYGGGISPVVLKPLPSIPDWVAKDASQNKCQADPVRTQVSASVRRLAYSNCENNADVIFYTIEGGGHTWPGGKPLPEWIAGHTSDDVNATGLMWEFFSQHPAAPRHTESR